MNIEHLVTLLPAMPVREVFVVLAAFCAGLMAASLAARLTVHLGPAPARVLADYLTSGPARSDPVEQLGRWLLRHLPGLASFIHVEQHRRWLALVGEAPSLATTLGLAVLLALGGVFLAQTSGIPLAFLLVGAGAIYPFARLRSQANWVRRQVERALPELTALMAAEMAAGNPPHKALERASAWGGPLSVLVGQAVAAARASNRPLFGRNDAPGVLVEVAAGYGLGSLQAFAAQLDLAARKGAAGPELMQSLARMFVLEYKERALREAEKLDSRLAVPSVLFFFLPFLFLILTPLLMPVLEAL